MAVFNAGVFGGGILADPRGDRATYGYRPAPPGLLNAIAAMADLCDEFDITLSTAALQASLREPLVDCTLVGMSRPERVQWTLDAATRTHPGRILGPHPRAPPCPRALDRRRPLT